MAKKKRTKKKKKLNKKQKVMLFFLRGGVVAGVWVCVAVIFYVGYCALDLPDVRQVTQPPLRPSVEIVAKDGSVFARYGDLIGDPVSVADVPKHVPQAILAIEDRRFYSHFGIDVFGILRAAIRNVSAGHTVQGGSTLTQQLAKNLFLSPARTMKRKVQEMLLAIWLERTYTKDEILTAYLNRVYLGSGAYGVDAAALTYFNKSARTLSIREAALIAGLLRAPSRYSPLHDPKQAMERSKVVLQAMAEEGFISEDQRRAAFASIPKVERRQAGSSDARYFSDWVYDQLGPLISDTQQDMVVRTTLDLSLQRIAERHIEKTLAENETAKGVSQAALITLDRDGAVRAMSGGRSYRASQFNRATQAFRQPGSAFKPIVYLTALERGMSPDDIVPDEPIKIGKYRPQNYDGKYRGDVSLRRALAESINTVAVRVLDHVGIDQVIETAKILGVGSPMSRNAALALGASEVTPLELATVYAAIATGGKAVAPYGIREIRNRSGQILFQHSEVSPPQVANRDAVATLVDMMQDVVKTGTGKAALLTGRPVAGKTGTTSDYRDAWFAGFTGNFTTVIWMGNDDNSSMRKVTGGNLPAMLWHDYMTDAEAGLAVAPLKSGGFIERAIEDAGAVSEDISKAFGDFIDSVLGTGR